MTLPNIDDMSAEELAPVLADCLLRLGDLGRQGALALLPHVDGKGGFDEAAAWIDAIASGELTAD